MECFLDEVAEDLHLDMAGAGDELFEEDGAVSKGGGGLAPAVGPQPHSGRHG